ncbi:MAG: DUF2207 domain-containing protein [Dehalococcoidia bacterium]|nr:DUF2207 domain-containing protein [Dehalococcoidia bacterium]
MNRLVLRSRPAFRRPFLLALAAACAALLLLVPAHPGAAAEAVNLFRAHYDVRSDGTVDVTEEILWDFGSASQHGINRDLVDRQQCVAPPLDSEAPTHPCPDGDDRRWRYDIVSVEAADAAGAEPAYHPEPYERSTVGDGIRLRIGDPDKTVSGAHWYRVRYRLEGALTAYPSHDELYWNALGDQWSVVVEQVQITVSLPAGAARVQVDCYQGPEHSTEPCSATVAPSASDGPIATYAAARALSPGDGLTLVAGWPPGLVAVSPPLLADRPSVDDYVSFEPLDFGALGLVGLASVVGLGTVWWRHGRDRRYRTLYYLTNDPSEETRPLFGHTDVVVEYLPPEDLRPAQMGLLLDERADTLDVTATVVDLAVRGYLHITEIPKKGWFGHTDWELERLKAADTTLLPYEQKLLDSLFADGEKVTISSLKNHFAERLGKVEKALYADAMQRRWFSGNPNASRNLWLFVGLGVAALGAVLVFAFAVLIGRALIPVPVVLAGLVLAGLSRAMGKRTAAGSEALRRVLGFRLYVATAETRRQEFNEQENIFARYLPFAIVFGCVDKWARAFSGLDDQVAQSTSGWYSGVGAFQVMAFSEGLRGFSSSVSSTISSTASSGGSGFSGGFSGGGGGGGGGSSW